MTGMTFLMEYVSHLPMGKSRELLLPSVVKMLIAWWISLVIVVEFVWTKQDIQRLIDLLPLVLVQRDPAHLFWLDALMEGVKVTWSYNAISIGLVTRECNGRDTFNTILLVKVRPMLGPMMKLFARSQIIKEVLKITLGATIRTLPRVQLTEMVMLRTSIVHALSTTTLPLLMLFRLVSKAGVLTCKFTFIMWWTQGTNHQLLGSNTLLSNYLM